MQWANKRKRSTAEGGNAGQWGGPQQRACVWNRRRGRQLPEQAVSEISFNKLAFLVSTNYVKIFKVK